MLRVNPLNLKLKIRIARVYIGTHLGLAAIATGKTKDIFVFVQFNHRQGPYQRYLTSTSKTELDSTMMAQVALDSDEKFRHGHWNKGVHPSLLVRPKF